MVNYVYPRLSRAAARPRVGEIRLASENNPEDLAEFVTLQEPRATLPATGGTSASVEKIGELRDAVMGRLSPWAGRVVGSGSSDFDRTLGSALHAEMQITPAEAAQEDLWTFLTVAVFPDVAYQRFPSLPDERVFGLPRNVLRRVWLRHELLGELLFSGTPPLQEDELVGLLERSALVRNRSLLRLLALEILRYEGRSRTAYTRELLKEVTLSTGPLMLDVLDQESLELHVRHCASKVDDR